MDGNAADTLGQAAHAIRSGALVGLPTETVYGLAADATNDQAVASIFAAKGRPQFNPLIIHVKNTDSAAQYVEMGAMARKLADHFWPGPFTMVVPRKADCPISLLVSAGLDTIAVRCPSHPLAQDLLAELDVPVAAPSANPSGGVSPTTAQHVREGLGDRVAVVLDGGPCEVGIESTIVGVSGAGVTLLRPGSITRAQIEAVTGQPVLTPDIDPSKPQAPGQLTSHYAPNASVRLNATSFEHDEAVIGFGPNAPADCPNLSASADLTEAAANLFSFLRQADAAGKPRIAVMPVPFEGLGEAINDRLARAAAPRDDTP